MAYTTADARQQMLDDVANAADRIGDALADLTEAYEHLDEDSADRLERELFRPVQAAYGGARRTHSAFASRYGFAARQFDQPSQPLPMDAKAAIERAIEALQGADEMLATLQDSMLPVEVGDPELRAGLSHVRELISPLPGRSRELLRTLGR
jgi:hypothetical protein